MIAQFHITWGWVAVTIAGLVGLFGVGLAIARRPPGRAFWFGVGAAVVAMLLQVGAGLILFATGERPGAFHVFYGVLMVVTFSLAYVYRSQLTKRPAIAYGILMLFVMGLGVRAILTFGE